MEMLKSECLNTLPPASVRSAYQWEDRKVARDCFISFNGTRYGVDWHFCGQDVKVRQRDGKLTILSDDGEIIYVHDVCHKARKHVWAKGQYNGLEIHEGKPYEPPYGRQIALDEVEIRPLSFYDSMTEVM